MYLTLILTWSFSTLSFLILVPVKSRTVKLGQRSCKKMAHSVDEFLADWYNMLILWIYVKVHLYFCVGYEAEWRNFHKQSGSDQSFSVSTRVGKREHTFHFLWIGGGDSQP